MLEAIVKSKTIQAAKAAGYTHYNFVSPGRRGVPDNFFVKKFRRIIFVEFKQLEGSEHNDQAREQQRLRDMGFEVYTVWSASQGREIFGRVDDAE